MTQDTPPTGGRSIPPRKLAGIGLEMVIPIVLFIYAGHRLDLWLDREPWFMVGGALIGIVVGFYNLYRAVAAPGK
jgi:F0F1-type ATP synthase assembly protein I